MEYLQTQNNQYNTIQNINDILLFPVLFHRESNKKLINLIILLFLIISFFVQNLQNKAYISLLHYTISEFPKSTLHKKMNSHIRN